MEHPNSNPRTAKSFGQLAGCWLLAGWLAGITGEKGTIKDGISIAAATLQRNSSNTAAALQLHSTKEVAAAAVPQQE